MKTRKMLFNAIVLPHLDYCCVVWANCNTPAAMAYGMSRAKLRWTILEQRRALQQLRVVHHCIHGKGEMLSRHWSAEWAGQLERVSAMELGLQHGFTVDGCFMLIQ